jgi:serine/threonine protein kinase
MEPDELEDYFSDKFSSISVKTSGTMADIATAVVSKPIFGLKEGETVALKSPKEPCKSSIARLIRESEILEMLMRLRVPEIITYYGCLATPDGVPVLVEEMADHNLTLLRRRKYKEDFPEALMDSIIERVAKGLSSVHGLNEGQGYLHRDIKPSNIYLFHGGLAKLGDFGSAGLNIQGRMRDPELGKGTSSGGAHGTPNYSAPETLGYRRIYSVSSEIYSLGCVGFYLIAGKTPFDDLGLENNFTELKNAKLGGWGYDSYIDRAIEQLVKSKKVSGHKIKAVRKALDPYPENRQKSVSEFLLEYQFESEETILSKGFESIQDLLTKTFDTNSDATPIEIVDAFLCEYEKILTHKQKYNLRSDIPENVRDLLEQRADKDYDNLRKYLDKENGWAITDLPSKEKVAERRRYVEDLFALIFCWGNSVRGNFVSDKTVPRIRQGTMNKEFFERWYCAHFEKVD